MTKTFIAGATSKQASATARALLASGNQVNAYVRNRNAPVAQELAQAGAELFEGDWDSPQLMRDAMRGCTSVFFYSMPSFTELAAEERWAANILTAATDSGTVRHVAYSTVGLLAQFDRVEAIEGWDENPFMAQYFRSKVSGEEAVRKWAAQGKDGEQRQYTILRPNAFMSNWLAPWTSFQVPDLISEGVWHTPFPADYPITQIDVEDIGRVAALVFENPEKWHGQEFGITAETLKVSQVLELLSEFSGKELKVSSYSEEEATELAKTNPLVKGQFLRLKSETPELWGESPLGLPFKLKTFREFLEENKDLVVETYKNVPDKK